MGHQEDVRCHQEVVELPQEDAERVPVHSWDLRQPFLTTYNDSFFKRTKLANSLKINESLPEAWADATMVQIG